MKSEEINLSKRTEIYNPHLIENDRVGQRPYCKLSVHSDIRVGLR